MNFRTDLALERHEIISDEPIEGVASESENEAGVRVSRISVLDERGEKRLGKPVGEYVTLEVKPFMRSAEIFDGRLTVLARELKKLIPKKGTVLVAGLGNESITPDALGPKVVSLLLATRHISPELAKSIGFGELRSVAGVVPGVLGTTGIETAEIIAGVVERIRPGCVIAVDALASRRLSRLGTTVQLANTGVSPGSGVGNARARLDESTLGVPVIAVGVPTVVDGATLAYDILEDAGMGENVPDPASMDSYGATMMVTPREIDLVIERAARLVAMGINCALQPHIEAEDILAVVSG